VVVNTGFVADTYMSTKKDIHLIRLKTPAEALIAMNCGTVDAWVCAQSSARAFLEKISNADEYAVEPIAETGDDYAFVVQKNNEQLATQINQALSDLKADGTIEQLKEKWKLS
jgi:ABC-type amino acid transport substrate-binding protein